MLAGTALNPGIEILSNRDGSCRGAAPRARMPRSWVTAAGAVRTVGCRVGARCLVAAVVAATAAVVAAVVAVVAAVAAAVARSRAERAAAAPPRGRPEHQALAGGGPCAGAARPSAPLRWLPRAPCTTAPAAGARTRSRPVPPPPPSAGGRVRTAPPRTRARGGDR